MTKGVHYDKVYAPVVSWTSICLLLTMIVLHNWTTKQIDYVQAFPQAPAEKDLYLKVLAGFEVEGGKKGDYALKLHKNVYGQKQSGNWNRLESEYRDTLRSIHGYVIMY